VLGICVVYLVRDPDSEALAREHLQRLYRHTAGNYRIYGVCLEGCEPTIRALAAEIGEVPLQIVPPPKTMPDQTSLQHSTLLDTLVEVAIADGCDLLAAFDNDSWPLQDAWNEMYAERLTESYPVASICRTEIGDNFPLAAFTIFRSSFWRSGESSFGSRLTTGFRDEFAEIATRPKETGSGILTQLRNERSGFLRLEKSNQWNPHYVMAAIYDGTIFHFGSGSRNPWFVWDHQVYETARNEVAIDFARRANDGIRTALLNLLADDADAFYAALSGSSMDRLEPLPTDSIGLPKTLGRIPRGRRHVIS